MIAVFLAAPHAPAGAFAAFNPELSARTSLTDDTASKLAYRAALFLLAGASLVWLRLRTRHVAPQLGATEVLARFLTRRGGIAVLAVAAVPLLHGLALPIRFYVLGAALLGAGIIAALRLPQRLFAIGAWAFLAAYVLWLAVPLWGGPQFLPAEALENAEWHFGQTLAQGDRLAAGLRLGELVHNIYGLLLPIGLGIVERHVGLLSFGAHVRIVQGAQVAFLLAAIGAFACWRRRPLFVVIATLFIGGWLATSMDAVFFPPQTGWRSVGFPLGVLALLAVRTLSSPRSATVLGAAAGLTLAINFEVGICVTCGYAVFLAARLLPRRLATLLSVAARAVASAAAVLMLLPLAYRLGFGVWPALNPKMYVGVVGAYTSAFGGLPFHTEPLAVLMFVHASFVVARSTIRWSDGQIDRDDAVRTAIASTMLVWGPYYVHRPTSWNLWTYDFLYAFLIADYLDPRFLARRWRAGAAALIDVRVAAVFFVVLPALMAINLQMALDRLFSARVPRTAVAPMSGLLVARWQSELLASKAAFVAGHAPDGIVYFSHNSYSIALLSGVFNRLPVQDAFHETITSEDFDGLLNQVRLRSPHMILFDQMSAEPADERDQQSGFSERFYERLRAGLNGDYRHDRDTSGWEVWVPRQRAANAEHTAR